MSKTLYNCTYLTSFRALQSRFTAYLLALLHNPETIKKMKLSTILLCNFLMLLIACQSGTQETPTEQPYGNPPAEGFDEAASDQQAIEIADAVMEAMGGRKAWDTTQYIAWNFFGNRSLLWDKQTGNVRIDSPRDSTIYLINVFDNTGKVMKNGEEITQPDSLQKYVDRGKGIWINDSYWLVMPFKLKDSGVTITYKGEDTLPGGNAADVLQLQFKDVGNTPQNKYDVVKQWAYYREASMDTPNFVTPWNDYQQYGSILLGGNRGERALTDIKILEEVPPEAFTSFEPVSL
jgi:hypothetical protein